MRADTVDLKRIFGRDIRYMVPLFQRPYVWNRDDNWTAFWEDIRRTAEQSERAAETGDTVFPHFLGAVVFDEARYASSDLEARQVIDGQQRLTTLQLFLFATRQAAQKAGDDRSVRLLSRFLENDRDLYDAKRNPDHRFKVWPTNADRDEFRSVMSGEESRGRLSEAVTYFQRVVSAWLEEGEDSRQRLGSLVQTLREHLRLVIIDLEEHDDAQMVFETLNSRGTPLEHADLVKNLLFREAEHAGADTGRLYSTYWEPFDQDEWRVDQTTGRITRSRLDVFLTHWLTMRTQRDFTFPALFKEFERWQRVQQVPVEEIFGELSRYAEIYDNLENHAPDGVEGRFLYRMKVMQMSTPMPLLLCLYGMGGELPERRRVRAIRGIDSYLVRRAVLNLSNRDYNHVFREVVTAAIKQPESADEAVLRTLAAMQGQHRQWPTDEEFRNALVNDPIYQRLYRHRVRILLEALEDALRTSLTEQLTAPVGEHVGSKLTIEHVMPQSWQDNWPIDGDDPDAAAARDEIVHTLGNLTLATARLNPAIGNMGWHEKRQWLGEHSLLRLTHGTLLNPPPGAEVEDWRRTWDETRIRQRGSYLANLALRIWPSPGELLAEDVNGE
ncbi:DUF262 domain-containing HNH endonuclease family protein [Streptomyces sp. S1A]|uniref:DUF262 domain-containing protein n=1 Tax=Streptomyces sp. ICN903 TaxID=2964654 RepID=UPI001EDC7A58|nr:DUF262 domain-containing protein [Streptomyces sp. ICN903]MCG3042733.1 DUF262 domain-containing HNH endonuclease family protein [Streptomyces sp. ICN903]